VPPTALRLMVRQHLDKWRFPHLRHCVTAGEPLNPEIMKLWKNATGHDLYEGYGQTESIILIGNYRSLNPTVQPGSMGKPTPGYQIALLDEALQEVPVGQEGEIALRVAEPRGDGRPISRWLVSHPRPCRA